jgi:excisionase family DNA binding protein
MRHSASAPLSSEPSPDSRHSSRSIRRKASDVSLKLKDLAHRTGPPLTTAELAGIIGMSATFIRKEIESGYLRATRMGRGRKRVFRIPLHEARRYVRELGLL